MHDMLRMDEFLHRLRHPGIMIAPVHTNEQWFPMVSTWQIILSINLFLLPQNVSIDIPVNLGQGGGGRGNSTFSGVPSWLLLGYMLHFVSCGLELEFQPLNCQSFNVCSPSNVNAPSLEG